MGIIDIISQRHSYRGKYKSVPVPREDLITIMKAGLDAPSMICVLTRRINAYIIKIESIYRFTNQTRWRYVSEKEPF